MPRTYRFVISTRTGLQNFLSIKETKAGDLIFAPRGVQHSVPVESPDSSSSDVDESRLTTSSITVHPNLKSSIGSITINYKDNVGGIEERKIAGVLDVKAGLRFFPLFASIGRNVDRPRLTILQGEYAADDLIHLWPGADFDLSRNSLAYSVLLSNPNAHFVFPEDFPRNVVPLQFQHFKIYFLYWAFNLPTKFRGTNLTFSTSKEYPHGLEFHEALNFTNDVTLMHAQLYPSLPAFP